MNQKIKTWLRKKIAEKQKTIKDISTIIEKESILKQPITSNKITTNISDLNLEMSHSYHKGFLQACTLINERIGED